MKALVSGQAATAVVFGTDRIYSIGVDDPATRVEREEWEVLWLFDKTDDIEQVDSEDESGILDALKNAWQKDRSIQLFLILLDRDEGAETRLAAAECLDEFLLQSFVKEFVENLMYAAPLPVSADLEGAIKYCSGGFLRVEELLQTLRDSQEEIGLRCAAWDNLPIRLFGSSIEKLDFRSDAIRFGAFRMFATERGKKNWAIVQLLNHPFFRGKAQARSVFKEWAAPFAESATSTGFEFRDEKDFDSEISAEVRRFKRSLKPHEAYAQAEKQRETIKELLTEGSQDQALRFTEQLIINQRRSSAPVHIAKSLCDLAQFSKKLGSPQLQAAFAKMAIAEVPSDAWSHATLGDAYRALGDYQEAQDAYHAAGALGDTRAAMIGRAEIFKDIGQLTDALTILNQCVIDYPSDFVCQNARASALSDFGRFEEALEAYDAILKDADDRVTLSGRAQVLRRMGRLTEALEAFDRVVVLYPDDTISQHARGETLRELGRLNDARETFQRLMSRFPLAAEMTISYAKILRDMGQFDESIRQYINSAAKHPWNAYGRIGLADTYRKIGDLDKAIKIYDEVIDKIAFKGVARNGKASILILRGDYTGALRLLPTNLPATLTEWVSFHIRGMAYMHSGKLERAERDFEWGLKENPWVIYRQYFQTALATLRIRQKRYEESIELVKEVSLPPISPLARVLTMHALGELGKPNDVAQAYQSVPETSAPIVISLRDVIAGRYLKATRTTESDYQIFHRECDTLLLAA